MPKVDKEKMKQNIDYCCSDKSQFTGICASTLGIFLVLAVLFLIFAKESLALLVPIVWAFIVLAIVALMFAYKAMKK
jgi:hypothetical protein